MGLRIIDRPTHFQSDITEADRLSGLTAATREWLTNKGKDPRGEAEFVAHFREVRGRLASPSSMVEMAVRIKSGIMEQNANAKAPHNKVDVATLLELL